MKLKDLTNYWPSFSKSTSKSKEADDARNKNSAEINLIINDFLEDKIDLNSFYGKMKFTFAKGYKLPTGRIIASLWGANNFKGMMFFNMLVKFSLQPELENLSNILRKSVSLPKDEEDAKLKIDNFSNWVRNFVSNLTEEKVKSVDPQRNFIPVKAAINPNHSNFFLTILWFIQDMKKFPAFWTASERVFKQTDYYDPTNSLGEQYKSFYKLNIDLISKIFDDYKEKTNLDYLSQLLHFIERQLSPSKNQFPPPPDPSKSLESYVKEFLKEEQYSEERAKVDAEFINRYQKIFDKDEIDFVDLNKFKDFYLSRQLGYVGFMTILNKTINEASDEGERKIKNTLKYLLYGDDDISERINNVLDEASDYKVKGLGESVILKLLATIYPEQYITVFNYKGKMGKREMLKLLEINLPENEPDLSAGELAVYSNQALIDKLNKFQFKNYLHMRDFLYWYKDKLEIAPPENLKKELIENTYLDEIFLDSLVDQLKKKGQIILYGAPGTGKTFIAKEIAKYLTGNKKENFKIIQFHPSYGYEDLIQSIFPKKEGESIIYDYKNGTFKEFCDQVENSETNYVFIIDEINRGNIPKIFGELIYLLEYRDEEINLQYSGDTFSIPKNISIIGTMNTADKSIALLDIALRRRFKFFEIEPSPEILKRFYQDKISKKEISEDDIKLAELIKVFNDLNKKIEEDIDKHHKIGHSYFMKSSGTLNKKFVNELWQFEVKPLLEEYFFDDLKRLKEYEAIFLSNLPI